MPLSPTGVYSLPIGYLAVTGQTIEASQHNPPLEDIQAVLSEAFYRTGVAPMLANLNFNTFKGINLANGSNPNDAVNFSQLQALTPLGVPLPYLGTAAPTGHIFCFGQAVSRTTYASLFAILGTTYGAGDGSTTFNIPDLRGNVLVGKDNMGGTSANRMTIMPGTTLGAMGGDDTVTLTVSTMPLHAHGGLTGSAGTHTHTMGVTLGAASGGLGIATGDTTVGENPTTRVSTNGAGAHQHGIAGEGGGNAHVNIQPSIIVNYILRTGV